MSAQNAQVGLFISPKLSANQKQKPIRNRSPYSKKCSSSNCDRPFSSYRYNPHQIQLLIQDSSVFQQYHIQHSKWGNLRNQMKIMKLDNYTTSTYKNKNTGIQSAINFMRNNQYSTQYKQNNASPQMQIDNRHSYRGNNIPVSKPSRKYTHLHNRPRTQIHTDKSSRKIVYREDQSNKQLKLSYKKSSSINMQPNKSKQKIKIAYMSRDQQIKKIELQTQKQLSPHPIINDNPENGISTKPMHLFTHNPQNNDLEVLQKINSVHINQRIIVRRKSQILQNNSSILAWEASICNNHTILIFCDQNQYFISDWTQSHLSQKKKKISTSKYQLLIGPYQCRKYKEYLAIQDLSMLASFLLDYVYIDYFSDKVKINQIFKKQQSAEVQKATKQAFRAMQNSSLIRLVKTAKTRVPQRIRSKASQQGQKVTHNYLYECDDSKDKNQCIQQPQKQNNQSNKPNEASQRISENISMMQASNNISEDLAEQISQSKKIQQQQQIQNQVIKQQQFLDQSYVLIQKVNL